MNAKLTEFAISHEIHLVGVAPIERFSDVPPQYHPSSIYPDATCVIACAQEIPRGAFRGVEEGTLWQRADRQIEAYYMYQLARDIEDLGYMAVPLSPLAQERWPEGVRFREGAVEPNVYPSPILAATLAGLGEVGRCGLFLTPQFGPRQALGMIVTNWPLEASPPFAGHVCDDCGECAAACPMGALKSDGTRDNDRCRYCMNGAFRDGTHPKAEPNRLTAACGRACLSHLEAGGRLEKKYETPFRRRPAWGLDLKNLR